MDEGNNDSAGQSIGSGEAYFSMDAPGEDLRRAAWEEKSKNAQRHDPQNKQVDGESPRVRNKNLAIKKEKKLTDTVFEDFKKAFELSEDELKIVTMSSDPEVQQYRIFGLVDMIGLPLDASFLDNMSKLKSALASIRDINPKDEIERMFAYNQVALQIQSEGMMRFIVKSKENLLENSPSLAAYLKVQNSLLKGSEALDKHRRGGKQQVVVKHLNVESGAQAVVGDVVARKVITETSERPMKDVLDPEQQEREKTRSSAKPSISKG